MLETSPFPRGICEQCHNDFGVVSSFFVNLNEGQARLADILRQNDTTLNKVKNTFISISQDYPINFARTKEQFKSIQNIFPGVRSVKSGQEKEYLDDIISAINCENSHSGSSEKTIVLVPYRDRPYNLKLFISPLHQHLMDQVR